MSSQHIKYVDAAFPLRGGSIPIDHGYALFSALSRHLPLLHDQRHWSVHPVRGDYQGRGVLALTDHSRVKLRLPGDDIANILDLAGKTLDIGGAACTLGFPKILPLIPAPYLKSRLVTIKAIGDQPEHYADGVRRQLAALPGLGQDPERIHIHIGPRRVLRVKGRPMVGYAVALEGLDAYGSIAVQRQGLGGRRHMGAGVFIPPARRA